ncbi:saccharopine dehydrogenase [Adhaeribacter aerolatus]|uniref:Saccharopine dehydrogenase n=1 Tax=Adhaeribacter aerolatus TaxID=670289 RepID=A0A512ATP3_9BACT|nr:saccharopine dehydrogenase C-terminal domain-containing protein [Adhaeribacter aerolatus]GEO03050.1 saccharopine dehydrogenase [Adhaeribacter aerolatus]
MPHIVVLGAGRSATILISYLFQQAGILGWRVTVADLFVNHLTPPDQDHLRIIPLNIQDEDQLILEVKAADLIISMLPAFWHPKIARLCVQYRKNLITASYVRPELKELHQAAKEANLLFLMEAGLDPGIDHMSAMAILNNIRQKGGKIMSYKSYTGGLVSPESDNNPWHYKFTWNPRNVVLAGQGTAKYLEDGCHKFIPYHQLFNRAESLEIPDLGAFDGYANRDSLLYQEPYGLREVQTLIRGTLRRRGYCQAWHLLVQLGLTDDAYQLPESRHLTYRQFLESYLPAAPPLQTSWLARIASYLNIAPDNEALSLLEYLEFPEEPIALEQATPAQVLEKLLLQKWQLEPHDKDMVVMQHLITYVLNGETKELTSSLVVRGEDQTNTAMAKTVGLPVGMAAKLILEGKLKHTGIVIPTHPDIYEPILHELKIYGIYFTEEERTI